ncbi:MAG TPA: M15 family metallopeptidase, partial [Rubricoccaceae bacterium]
MLTSPSVLVAVLLSLVAAGGCQPSAAEPERPAEAPVVIGDGLDLRPTPGERPPAPPLPAGFSYLRDAAPEIGQEMRYATAFNFAGEPIDGYRAPTCILTTEAARALARVDADLAAQGLGLKVYDCYRPQAAVDHFVRWARSGQETM